MFEVYIEISSPIIWLGWKDLRGTNTLAYFAPSSLMLLPTLY